MNSSQTITIDNRKTIKVTDVLKVLEINPKEAIIDTTLGKLLLKGDSLEIKQYDIDKKYLLINGVIDSLGFTTKDKKKEKGLLQKLFQ